MGFESNTVYKIYIKDQNKVIRIKDLQIYEDFTSKAIISLPDFEEKLTFDKIQIPDKQTSSDKSSAFKKEKNMRKQSPKKTIKSWAGRTIKSTYKSMTNNRDKVLITSLVTLLDNNWENNNKVTTFLASCHNNDTSNKIETKIDLVHILTTAIHKANKGDTNKFTSLTQLDIEEPKTYEQAIYGPHRQ